MSDSNTMNSSPRQLQAHIQELEVLNALSRAVTTARSFDSLFSQVGELLQAVFTFDRLSISLYDPETDQLETFALRTTIAGTNAPEGTISPVPPLLRPVITDHQGILTPDLREVQDPLARQLVADGLRTAMAVPLLHAGHMLGVLGMLRREVAAYEEEDLDRLQRVAVQLAPAVENVRLYQEVEKNKERYRTLFEQATDAIFLVDTKTSRVLDVNQRACQHLGYSREELRGMPLSTFNVVQNVQDLHVLVRKLQEQGRLVFQQVHRRRDGTMVPVEISSRLMEIDGQTITQSFVRDISEREALQAAAATVSSSLELDEVLDLILTELGRVIAYDSATIFILEGDVAVIAASCHLSEAGKGRHFSIEADPFLQEMMETGQPVLLDDARTHPHFKGWVETGNVRGWMGVPLISPDGLVGFLTLDSRQSGIYSRSDARLALSFAQHAAAAINNARLHEKLRTYLAELEVAQTRLLQSEKLATIGEMMAGVAHELNNPLGVILLYAQLLQQGGKPFEQREGLAQIEEQAGRARDIIRSLLDFARHRPPHYELVQVDDLLRSALAFLTHRLREQQIVTSLELAPDLPPVKADAGQLQQVFVNLLRNAIQALESEQSGQLALRTRRCHSRFLPTRERTAPEVIQVEVYNDGPPIPRDNLPRIFDPFFTTREPGQGTGLGLAVSHGIIQAHGGNIWAESRQGAGVTFFVELPFSEVAPAPTPVEAAIPKATVEVQTGRALVVDDEPNMRLALQGALEALGLAVDSAAEGNDGLEWLAQQTYTLVLCDVRMPGLDGIGFFHRVQKQYPRLASRILFVTGDAVRPETRHFLEENELPYLVKPFDIQTLQAKIRMILDEDKQ